MTEQEKGLSSGSLAYDLPVYLAPSSLTASNTFVRVLFTHSRQPKRRSPSLTTYLPAYFASARPQLPPPHPLDPLKSSRRALCSPSQHYFQESSERHCSQHFTSPSSPAKHPPSCDCVPWHFHYLDLIVTDPDPDPDSAPQPDPSSRPATPARFPSAKFAPRCT